MLRIGRNLRDLDCPIKDEIEFSYKNKFDIIQVLYKCDKIDSVYEDNIINNTEFLLDVVHVLYADDYEYLKKLISIKKPRALHIADTIKGKIGKKHLHLPIGKGIINFEKIFNDILPNYDDLIILEIKNTDYNILQSKDKIKNIINR